MPQQMQQPAGSRRDAQGTSWPPRPRGGALRHPSFGKGPRQGKQPPNPEPLCMGEAKGDAERQAEKGFRDSAEVNGKALAWEGAGAQSLGPCLRRGITPRWIPGLIVRI